MSADRPQFYTGISSVEPFANPGLPGGGPAANDVTAAFYLILRTTDLTPDVFICPQGIARYEAFDVQKFSNFPAPHRNSYSYANPYPSAAAVAGKWKFDTSLTPDDPFAADMNYGDNPQGGPTKVSYTSNRLEMRTANSANHWFDGQQVVYADGHVEWQTTPFCGAVIKNRLFRDNIYANVAAVDPVTGRGGTVHGAPQNAGDAVLLPTAFDGPTGAVLTVERLPSMTPPETTNSPSQLLIVGLVVASILGVWAIVRLRKPSQANAA
ncbi:hypothetical protein [Humisphaera borealis]|uniref:Uncharacterized protein n=1 Tax=Humisphaera borealis TaxID=2807512 RepID=A0A7M2WSD5_9BACT|nr:hypothetical protein [Humisphaera borealis]QOV88329.1 hypothetical protein IPV69_19045 [Humisphaera borealis]